MLKDVSESEVADAGVETAESEPRKALTPSPARFQIRILRLVISLSGALSELPSGKLRISGKFISGAISDSASFGT